MTGDYLARLREHLGKTQQEIADAIGVSRVTVSRWETGDMRMERPDWVVYRLRRARLWKRLEG